MNAEQLGFEGMPQRLYSCTPSRLNNWLDCPRRYRMTYLDRPQPPKGPPWAHNSLGASVHNALAAWWRLPEPRRTVEMSGTLLLRGWLTDGFRDAGQSEAWRTRAREMVEAYVSGLDPHTEPVGVERTVATRTDVIALSGRIDRLDETASGPGTELVVVDYKTGRRALTADDARGSLALALYAIAASRMLRSPCRRVELHHLPTGGVAAWEHTEESLLRQLGRAERIAVEARDADEAYRTRLAVPQPRQPRRPERSRRSQGPEGPERRDGAGAPVDHEPFDEVFPPRPGRLCAWCDFSRHCPEGRQAAAPAEPWAALAETSA
ncbi:RecB family exonuclease [Actinomadura scrupuli]|uniref:RecB family exonuclease n=1 Tax=Actinomadura scrupuli TaxID=559629 RepID=UPI003D96875C